MYLAIEGIDGAGKTSAVEYLPKHLPLAYRVATVVEPSSDLIGKTLRGMISRGDLSPTDDARVIAYMLSADRAYRAPVLDRLLGLNDLVITDRSVWSMLAYQGHYVPDEELGMLASQFRTPDAYVLLDLEPEVALSRVASRGELDAFETTALLHHARRRYKATAKLLPRDPQVYVVDASEPNLAFAQITDLVAHLLESVPYEGPITRLR